jgi:hypothetical protein
MSGGISSDIISPPPARPRDGPATSFEVDPIMTEILENSRNDNDFGLVLVVGWPPNPETLEKPYNALVKAMRSCFDDKDQEKGAYFYPLNSLHVTVATLHAFALETRDANRRAVLEREWRSLVVAASKRLEWPKQPLKLKVESCQIGSRAGILLWREETGGLERMRKCIREENRVRREQLEQAAISVDTLRIPGIIHSTVLRFPFPIVTDGNAVQEGFQRLVLPRLDEMFAKTTVEVDTAVLVCERTPYLHHPYDERHALETLSLTDE